MAEKKNHTLLKITGTLAATAAVSYAGVTAYAFKEIFQTKNSRFYTDPEHFIFKDGEMTEWYHHSVTHDEYITSYDGLKLHALSMRNHEDSHQWILLAYGPGKHSKNLTEYLYEFDHAGYNILTIDSRGFGKSEGKYTTLGCSEHYDVISWINFIINADPDASISLFGTGIGANAVMNAAGDYLPSQVKCAVEEGGFTEIKDLLRLALTDALKIDGNVILPALNLMVKQFLHFSIYDVSTHRQLQQAQIPMLFIHGSEDSFLPESMLFDNFYAYGAERTLMTLQEAEKDYFGGVFQFLDSNH